MAGDSTLFLVLKFLPWAKSGNDGGQKVEKSLLAATIIPALCPSEAYTERLGRVGAPRFMSFFETEFTNASLAQFWDKLSGTAALGKAFQHWDDFRVSTITRQRPYVALPSNKRPNRLGLWPRRRDRAYKPASA